MVCNCLFAGFPKAYQLVEFFAGCSSTTFAFRKRGYRSVRLDIKYGKRRSHHKTDYMDLNSASGFLFLGPILSVPLFAISSKKHRGYVGAVVLCITVPSRKYSYVNSFS